jgi:hypothetical protein
MGLVLMLVPGGASLGAVSVAFFFDHHILRRNRQGLAAHAPA